MNNESIVVEQWMDAAPDVVWQALTQPQKMKQWYFDIPEFQPLTGFTFSFAGQGKKGATYHHLCRIGEVIPAKKLEHSWRYESYEGDSFVTFALEEENGGTRVRLTHSGLESFPQSNPDFARENFVEGWTYIIKSSLKDFVEKNSS